MQNYTKLKFPALPSNVASQCSWLHKYIKTYDKTIFDSSLSVKGINFVGQLFQNNKQIKKWDELITEFDLIGNEKFLIPQITHAVLGSWKQIIQNYAESIKNLIIKDHHLIKKYQMFSLTKLNNAILYEVFIDASKIKPTY